MAEILFKEESYKMIGLGMEVHKELGAGFQEAVYKDALEYEVKEANIPYEREKGTRYLTKKLSYKDVSILTSSFTEVSSLKQKLPQCLLPALPNKQ